MKLKSTPRDSPARDSRPGTPVQAVQLKSTPRGTPRGGTPREGTPARDMVQLKPVLKVGRSNQSPSKSTNIEYYFILVHNNFKIEHFSRHND